METPVATLQSFYKIFKYFKKISVNSLVKCQQKYKCKVNKLL